MTSDNSQSNSSVSEDSEEDEDITESINYKRSKQTMNKISERTREKEEGYGISQWSKKIKGDVTRRDKNIRSCKMPLRSNKSNIIDISKKNKLKHPTIDKIFKLKNAKNCDQKPRQKLRVLLRSADKKQCNGFENNANIINISSEDETKTVKKCRNEGIDKTTQEKSLRNEGVLRVDTYDMNILSNSQLFKAGVSVNNEVFLQGFSSGIGLDQEPAHSSLRDFRLIMMKKKPGRKKMQIKDAWKGNRKMEDLKRKCETTVVKYYKIISGKEMKNSNGEVSNSEINSSQSDFYNVQNFIA